MKLARPFSNWTTYQGHGGIDYPEPLGTPVRASAAGVVDYAGWYSSRGGYAKFVDYGNGIRCGYYHLRDLAGLKVGQSVQYGTAFAFVGNTGFSTGPHLHHEVWVNGRIIAPPQYWDHIDSSRYVGDGSGAGVPIPTPDPPTPPPAAEPEEQIMTDVRYVRLNDQPRFDLQWMIVGPHDLPLPGYLQTKDVDVATAWRTLYGAPDGSQAIPDLKQPEFIRLRQETSELATAIAEARAADVAAIVAALNR